MIDGPMSKLLQFLPGILVLALIAGGILFGWARGRGQSNPGPKGRSEMPFDGWLGDDDRRHHDMADHGGDAGPH